MQTDLTVIILNYNTSALLKNCLVSIQATKEINLQVIVVDNASRDDSVAMVKQMPGVELIESPENLGFAGGNNLALPFIQGRYVLFLNSDTLVPANTLGRMVKFMDQNPDCGIATCRVDLKIGGIDKDCHRGFPTPWNSLSHFIGLERIFPKSKFFNSYYLGFMDFTKIHEVGAVSGAFLMVRKVAADKLGYWDDTFFFYGEDLDFCFRYKTKGWKILYNPEVSIIHYKGASSGFKKESQQFSQAQLETKRRVASESVRAMRIFYDKYYVERYPWFINKLVKLGLNVLEWKRVSKYK